MEGFAEALRAHVTGQQTLREVPKEQRFIGRMSLKRLFDGATGEKAKRARLIWKAVYQHGYSQTDVARHLKLHYSTVSRLIKAITEEQR
jgi:DNA-binding MarR family transcriptional regulator